VSGRPSGKSPAQYSRLLSSPFCKNILVFRISKSPDNRRRPDPHEGRLEIVADAGKDAVDADVPLTNGADADGEVVWF
jgi:hypothetical protein